MHSNCIYLIWAACSVICPSSMWPLLTECSTGSELILALQEMSHVQLLSLQQLMMESYKCTSVYFIAIATNN